MVRRTLLGLGLPIAVARARSKAVRILWTGSSSMYYHNMPRQVADWLNRSASTRRRYESSIVGRSGSGIHVYLKPGTFKPEYGFKDGQSFLEKIAAERNDFVVLQAVAGFITGTDATEHAAALKTYCGAIRGAGGEPVFYEMGWGAADGPGRARILEVARKEKIKIYAPCSTAWARVRAERPDLELHNSPDRTHPGTLGHYLNLCCFFTAFSRKNPLDLPLDYSVWLALDDAGKQEAERKVAERGRTSDPYYEALPQFLKRRAVMAQPYRLAPDTGDYLKKVAWETWREASRRLTG